MRTEITPLPPLAAEVARLEAMSDEELTADSDARFRRALGYADDGPTPAMLERAYAIPRLYPRTRGL